MEPLIDHQQINYVRGILNNRRERYKLIWNALIGLIVAVIVGLSIRIAAGQIVIHSRMKFFFSILVFIPLLLSLFFAVFFVIILTDETEKALILNCYNPASSFFGKGPATIWDALNFIETPYREWQIKALLDDASLFVAISSTITGIVILVIPEEVYTFSFIPTWLVLSVISIPFLIFIVRSIIFRYTHYKTIKSTLLQSTNNNEEIS